MNPQKSSSRRAAIALFLLAGAASAQDVAQGVDTLAATPSATPGVTPAPSAATDISAGFAVPAGCEVSLWAESPLLYNPTAIDIDPQGRVWVSEAVNYRQWDGRNPGLHHEAGDRIVVLEDKDGDGRAESSTVFAQDADLVSPLGICWLPDKVLVSCSPTVWAYYDDDGDLRADRKEVFLTGFGGPNHDHGAHSFVFGPDGRLYMALGNAGPHIVTDKSGWTLRSGSAYDGGGEHLAGNRPGLVSDDGRTWVGGLILRCNTDGTGLTVLAHNFRNPYEVAVDAFGDLWTFDNDDDGNQGCRVCWILEGGNYGYMSADGSRFWQADRRPGQNTQRAHWHQDDPGVAPTTLITGSGGPTGVCVYEGDALPKPLHGALLCADAGRNCVFALRRERDGAGFKLLPLDAAAAAPHVNGLTPDGTQLTALITSRPAHEGDETWRLFRPSDVCVAPDGSVLIADWFDPGVGGHQAGDRAAYGRLLRVSPARAGSHLAGTAPDLATAKGLVAALASPAQSVRALAHAAALATRPTNSPTNMPANTSTDAASGAPITTPATTPASPSMGSPAAALAAAMHDRAASVPLELRARAAWMLADLAPDELWPVTAETYQRLKGADCRHNYAAWEKLWKDDARVTLTRLRGLRLAGETATGLMGLSAGGVSKAAGRELLLMLRDERSEVGNYLLADLMQYYSQVAEHDPALRAAMAIAWEGKASPPDEHLSSPALARLAPLLRPELVCESLLERARHKEPVPPPSGSDRGLNAEARAEVERTEREHIAEELAARAQAINGLGFCRSREAAEGMLALALAGPEDTRELAAWWVRHNDATDWRAYDLARHLDSEQAWTDDDIVWRSGPVTRGSVPVDVDIAGSRRVALVVTASDNGNGCDWADWLEPRFTVASGEVRLAVPGAPAPLSATAEWGSVRIGNNCEGGPLVVDGVTFTEGLGTHALSEIVFAVPEGAARLLATAAPDDQGRSQPNAPTKVEFLVYADRAAVREAAAAAVVAQRAALLETLRSPAADLEARVAAGEALAAEPQGGALLLAEAASGRLATLAPDDARAELLDGIAAAIFTNPDLGVRALASEHFTRPGMPALPPMAELVALPGDRRAGQALFFGAARCDACHAVAGRGGDVGPELTTIRTKYGRAELLDAILNPSAAIGAGFESVTLTLQDGRVLAGLLQADGATVLLKDGTGARHVIAAADIAERRASKLSLMPEDIARALSPQQLADLCAFLQHDRDASPTFGPVIPLWNGRDLSGWVGVPDTSAWSVRSEVDATRATGESGTDGETSAASAQDGEGASVLHDEGQPIGYIRTERAFTSFELTVEWRFPDPSRPGNSGVLLRVQSPDEVWPRSIEAQLNSGDAGDIWNIGDFPMVADAARTSGRRTVKLLPSSERALGEWNTYRITLRDGDLTMEVNGQVQNRAAWCAELPGSIALQSEGAPIEFRRVELREILE